MPTGKRGFHSATLLCIIETDFEFIKIVFVACTESMRKSHGPWVCQSVNPFIKILCHHSFSAPVQQYVEIICLPIICWLVFIVQFMFHVLDRETQKSALRPGLLWHLELLPCGGLCLKLQNLFFSIWPSPGFSQRRQDGNQSQPLVGLVHQTKMECQEEVR